MKMRIGLCVTTLLLAMAAGLPAQSSAARRLPDVSGTYQADTPDGPKSIVVRPDSSASFGDETVRFRVRPDTILIAFGGEWLAYNFVLRGKDLTLSGGDLEEPFTLKRVGPATPRPAGVDVPAAPPDPPGR